MAGKAEAAVLFGESGNDVIRKLVPVGRQQVPGIVYDVPAEMTDTEGMAVLVWWFKEPGGNKQKSAFGFAMV